MPSSGARRAIAPLLVVDPDDDTRAALTDRLEREGYAVRAVPDALSARIALGFERFRLVLVAESVLFTEDMPGVAVLRTPEDLDELASLVREQVEAAERARSRDLLAAMSDVRKQLEKTMHDLDTIRRGRGEGEAPPSTRRGGR